MTAIAESLALDDPIRWNWCVRAIIPDTGCTAQNQGQTYVVIKRSFDPVTWEPSSYINGALYTYVLVFLGTSCGNGDAIELTVDPLAFNYSAIASWGSSAFKFGTFFTGLTRDDVGGLRYLYRPSNYNWEQISPEVQVVANAGSPWTPVGATNAVPSTLALRQGIDKVRYEKRSFDSLLGTFFTPFTNTFSTTIVTNGTAYQQVIGRAVLAPDVLISAGDITQNGFGGPLIVRTVGNPYNSVTTVTGVNGPGSRSPITQFILNKVGPVWTGHTPEFIRENQVTFNYAWGSFDGTTNAPVIYPSGRSIRDLEALVLQGSGSSGGGPFTPAP